MAITKNIAVKLDIIGLDTSVSSIKQLEASLVLAKQAIENFDRNNKNFEKFKYQINAADSELKNLKKSLEGVDTEQKVGAYAKLGSAITSSFAAASTALSLFGIENENVAQAAATAQQALTLALAGREVAEAAVAATTIAADIATKASTASTNAANAATKRFYATLAANPYTALLVGIGLLVAGITLLISRTDEAAKKQRELEKTVRETAGKEIAEYRRLTKVVNDNSIAIDTRKEALESLKAKYPGYFQNLKDEEILNGKVKVAIDGITGSLLARARANALTTRIEENVVRQLEIETKLTDLKKQQVEAQKLVNELSSGTRITGGGSVIGVGGGGQALNAAEQSLNRINNQINSLTAENSNLEKQNIQTEKSITDLTKSTNGLFDGEVKTKEATKGLTDAQKALLEALELRLKGQTEIITSLNQINEADTQVSAEILERAKKTLEQAKALLKERNDFFESENDKFITEINRLFFDVIPTEQELKDFADNYNSLFNSIVRNTSNGQLKLLDETGKAIKLTLSNLPGFAESLGFANIDDIGKISESSQRALIQFTTRFAAFVENAVKGFRIADVLFTFDETDITKKLSQGISRAKEILNDESILPGLRETKLAEVVAQIFQFPEKTLKDFTGGVEQQKIKLNAYNEGVQAAIKNGVEFLKVQGKVAVDTEKVNTQLESEVEQIRLLREELGILTYSDLPGYAEQLQYTAEQQEVIINKLVERTSKAPELFITLLGDINDRLADYIKRFGQDGVNNLLTELAKGFTDVKDLTQEQLVSIEFFLSQNLEFISATYGPEITAVFTKLLENVRKTLAAIPTDTQKQFQETLKNLRDGIAEFQGVLQNLGQTFSDYYSAQIDILAQKNAYLQGQIVGDTEQANNKRLELEKGYQAEKLKLEKQAARASLAISLVQATANVAESITKALTTGIPVVAQISAGINAAIGAAQVAIIAQQLGALNRYQKGGITKGQQGFIVQGPSHEYGGVKFAGGGMELEGGEAVLNRLSSIKYQGLLSQINQAGGGVPLMSSGFDDSRIVEAIARQRNEPIRAYVVENDITSKQSITRRLEQLAQY